MGGSCSNLRTGSRGLNICSGSENREESGLKRYSGGKRWDMMIEWVEGYEAEAEGRENIS